jgi:flavin-dependent thymidylate synthase
MRNKVELIGHYGSDKIHALSAWTSTSRELNKDKEERIPRLLTMLGTEGHHTPFEKSMLHFLVEADQATHIHLLKHRIGASINGESARYKELKEDKLYLPSDWLTEPEAAIWYNKLHDFTCKANELYHSCLEELTPIVGRTRAKESARYFKTMNSQITLDVSFNFRSFAHFYHLRSKDNAQVEVANMAKQMLQAIKDIPGKPFKDTLIALGMSET